jgi:hypothetical protein
MARPRTLSPAPRRDYRNPWRDLDQPPTPRPLTREQRRLVKARERGHVPLTNIWRPAPADGCCECCNKPAAFLVPDHDHVTGQLRGWLCNNCNVGIGMLGDTLDSVQMALDYMRLHAPR